MHYGLKLFYSMSDDSMSGSDMEVEDVTEGANVRVVQSSMHASIIQSNLFKVVENKKESDNESEAESEKKKKEEIEISPIIIQENKEKSPTEENKESIKDILTDEDNKKMESEENKPKEIARPAEKKYSKAVRDILSDTKPVKPHHVNVEQRFYEYKSKVSKKIEMIQEEMKKKELESCTFAPKINSNKEEKRKFDQFLSHVTNFEKAKKDKIEKLQKEKEESETPDKKSFKPSLSQKTLKLTSGIKNTEIIHERLYKESKILKEKQELLAKHILEEECSFKPKLNEQSDLLKREGKIEERLYEMSKEKKKEILDFDEKAPEKLVNPESEAMISEKFIKEISEAFPVKAPDAENSMNFTEFLGILEKIHFIQTEEKHPKYTEGRELSQKA